MTPEIALLVIVAAAILGMCYGASPRRTRTASQAPGTVLLITVLLIAATVAVGLAMDTAAISPLGALIIASASMLPAIIAGLRRHHNVVAIFVLNLLLGWTIVGWIIALVWSLTTRAPRRAEASVATPTPAS